MALSTAFALPNPSFDPSKYGRKSSASTTSDVKYVALPETEIFNTILPTRTPGTSDPVIENAPSPVKATSTETTSAFLQPAASVTIKHTSYSIKVNITKEPKPTPIPEIKIEQPTCFPDIENNRVKSAAEEIKPAFSPEVKDQQAASISDPKVERVKPATGDAEVYPATLITAESFDLASIPAPDDAQPKVSSDTRRLVSIRRIRNIRQAKVESRWLTLAQVDEWTCTVPRHAFREGELVVYIEIDAFLPCADRRFGKMSSLQTFDGDLGHRVKTRRFGSYPDKLTVQGHIYPLNKFDEIFWEIKSIRQALNNVPGDRSSENLTRQVIRSMYRNEDWAARIGVKKWEEPNPVNKPDKHPKLGAVPTRVFRKTDITHFEDCPNLFTKRKYFAYEYQESIKMDGASMSVYFVKNSNNKYHDLNELPQEVGPNTVHDNGRFGVTSKAVDLNELATCKFGFWRTALKNDLPAKLVKLARSIAIQGEICGPDINQNREKLEETEFFVYSMWDITAQRYIDARMVETLAKKLGLKHVPVLRYIKIRDIASSHKELRDLADKRSGEGLVYKAVHDGRSFKVHSPAYKVLHNC